MNNRVILSAALVALGCVGAAEAGTICFNYSDPAGLHATMHLTTVDLGGGLFEVVAASTLTIDAGPASMIGSYSLYENPAATPGVFPSPSTAFNVDNILYNPPTAYGTSYLDDWGLLFTAPGFEINIWGNPGGQGHYTGMRFNGLVGYDYRNDFGTMTETPCPIPLPTPIAMASAGLLAIAGVSRRRIGR